MVTKTQTKLDYPLQSEACETRVYGRDYRALLRSTGHLHRDGRWLLDEDDPFHVYREVENPGLGSLRTYRASDHFLRYDPSIPEIGPERTYNWRPALASSFTRHAFDGDDDVPPPEPQMPKFEDYALSLNAIGTNFIRRLRPGNPVGPLGQFLIELHDLPRLPLLFQRRAKHFRDLGSEYLNVEFGWKPFVSDVIKIGHTQLRMAALLDKLVKGNGIRTKRRSKREPVETGEDWHYAELPYPFGWMGDPAYGIDNELVDFYTFGPFSSGIDSAITGETLLTWRHATTSTTWYVGEFFYYVPDIGSSQWTDKAKLVLLGGEITPSLLYQVYPWTWLADWFANVGDILSNLSSNAVDSEVLRDSHVMQTIDDRLHVHARVDWDSYVIQIGDQTVVHIDPGFDTLQFSRIGKQKMRQRASPFGFGLKYEQFSFAQKSILAALLFSRKRPSMRTIGF